MIKFLSILVLMGLSIIDCSISEQHYLKKKNKFQQDLFFYYEKDIPNKSTSIPFYESIANFIDKIMDFLFYDEIKKVFKDTNAFSAITLGKNYQSDIYIEWITPTIEELKRGSTFNDSINRVWFLFSFTSLGIIPFFGSVNNTVSFNVYLKGKYYKRYSYTYPIRTYFSLVIAPVWIFKRDYTYYQYVPAVNLLITDLIKDGILKENSDSSAPFGGVQNPHRNEPQHHKHGSSEAGQAADRIRYTVYRILGDR